MAESADALDKLEEKVQKAADVFKRLQAEKRALQQEFDKFRAEGKDKSHRLEGLERELAALRREREEVRGRIEKLLEQIDSLTKVG